jgi:hypothetical protein
MSNGLYTGLHNGLYNGQHIGLHNGLYPNEVNVRDLIKPPPGCYLNAGHPMNIGVVARYLFNEKKGNTLTDYSGNRNHGTLTNFALSGATSNWVENPFGGGLSFDGSNDYINVGDKISLRLGNVGSIIIRVKKITNVAFARLIGKAANSPASSFIYMIDCGSVGDTFRGYLSGGADQISTGSINTGQWYIVCFTWGVNLNIYLNGVKAATPVTRTASLDTTSTYPFTFGLRFATFPNVIYDFAIVYNRELYEGEISTLSSKPNSGIISPNYYNPQ